MNCAVYRISHILACFPFQEPLDKWMKIHLTCLGSKSNWSSKLGKDVKQKLKQHQRQSLTQHTKLQQNKYNKKKCKNDFALNKNITFHISTPFTSFESISVHLTFLKCQHPKNQWPTNWMAKKVFLSFLHLSFRCGAMRAHNRHSIHRYDHSFHRQCFNFNGFANEMRCDEGHKTVLVANFVCLLSVITSSGF